MLATMLLLSVVAPAVPAVEELEDLPRVKQPQIERIRRNFERAGVLVPKTRLDSQGVPIGVPIDQQYAMCDVVANEPIFEPFDGDERVASECSGYFVTERCSSPPPTAYTS